MINEFKQATFEALDTHCYPFHIINSIKKKTPVHKD